MVGGSRTFFMHPVKFLVSETVQCHRIYVGKKSLQNILNQSLRDFTGSVFAVIIYKQARRGDSRG